MTLIGTQYPMLKPGNITCFELTRFSVPGDQHADGMCSARHSG